jgi:putative acetyltransferase
VNVREERSGDREAVRDIHLRAFGAEGAVVADLVDTLRDAIRPGEGISLVAEHAGQVVAP